MGTKQPTQPPGHKFDADRMTSQPPPKTEILRSAITEHREREAEYLRRAIAAEAELARLRLVVTCIKGNYARLEQACNLFQENSSNVVEVWEENNTLRSRLGRIESAARSLLALMDSVPVNDSLGDETDRVFPRYEFDDLRAAMESDHA